MDLSRKKLMTSLRPLWRERRRLPQRLTREEELALGTVSTVYVKCGKLIAVASEARAILRSNFSSMGQMDADGANEFVKKTPSVGFRLANDMGN